MEYFWSKRGTQLTAAQVSDDLDVGKHTAIKRLEAADGWGITQKGQGRIPDTWECSSTTSPWMHDPWE